MTDPGLVVAFDPGVDDLGWARFRPIPYGVVDPRTIASSYVESGIAAVSSSGTPTVERLARLADVARSLLLSGGGAVRCVIEQPVRAGSYRRLLPRQRTKQQVNAEEVALVYMAVGVLVSVALALGLAAELWPASTKPKLLRLQIIASYWPRFRQKVYTRGSDLHPRGSPKPDDESDAVYLGLSAVTVRHPPRVSAR